MLQFQTLLCYKFQEQKKIEDLEGGDMLSCGYRRFDMHNVFSMKSLYNAAKIFTPKKVRCKKVNASKEEDTNDPI